MDLQDIYTDLLTHAVIILDIGNQGTWKLQPSECWRRKVDEWSFAEALFECCSLLCRIGRSKESTHLRKKGMEICTNIATVVIINVSVSALGRIIMLKG